MPRRWRAATPRGNGNFNYLGAYRDPACIMWSNLHDISAQCSTQNKCENEFHKRKHLNTAPAGDATPAQSVGVSIQSFSRCNFLSPFLSSFPSTVFVEWAIRAVVVVMLSVSLTLCSVGPCCRYFPQCRRLSLLARCGWRGAVIDAKEYLSGRRCQRVNWDREASTDEKMDDTFHSYYTRFRAAILS